MVFIANLKIPYLYQKNNKVCKLPFYKKVYLSKLENLLYFNEKNIRPLESNTKNK